MHRTTQTVLITGASSGIGEATARRLAADGHTVFVGARRTDRLDRLVRELVDDGHRAAAAALDVTSRSSVEEFAAAARERFGPVDVLINNAGVMPLSPLDALHVAEWDQMIDVNLRGTLYAIAAVLPEMRARGRGHVVNLASTAAHRVDATAAVYCATKYAVRALSEGLRQETDQVRVTVISPGFTRSELVDRGGDPTVQSAVRAVSEQLAIPASAVAAAISYAISQPDDVDVSEVVVRPTAQR